MYLKSVDVDNNTVGVEFYVMDSTGNYYTGFSEKDFKNHWCNVWLQATDGEMIKIENYTIT
jgi:hypothetical protein